MLELLSQTLAVTLPVFVMVLLGVLLRRLEWIDEPFIATASSLVFKGCMPTLLFLSLVKAGASDALSGRLVLVFVATTLGSVALALGWAVWRVPCQERAVCMRRARSAATTGSWAWRWR